jgi:syntaxin 18
LTEVSQSQKEMQEERVQRQLEKARTLGSSVASYSLENGRGSWGANSTDTLPESSRDGSSFRKTPSSLPQLTQTDYEPSEEDEEDDLELSPSQILQFESENAAILQQVESVLHEVQQAESRLLDISALQTQLVVELARQTEVVDQLYDEAMITQGEVQKGNVQLKQAKERAKESRKWLLLFIIGATLAILFLDYYD